VRRNRIRVLHCSRRCRGIDAGVILPQWASSRCIPAAVALDGRCGCYRRASLHCSRRCVALEARTVFVLTSRRSTAAIGIGPAPAGPAAPLPRLPRRPASPPAPPAPAADVIVARATLPQYAAAVHLAQVLLFVLQIGASVAIGIALQPLPRRSRRDCYTSRHRRSPRCGCTPRSTVVADRRRAAASALLVHAPPRRPTCRCSSSGRTFLRCRSRGAETLDATPDQSKWRPRFVQSPRYYMRHIVRRAADCFAGGAVGGAEQLDAHCLGRVANGVRAAAYRISPNSCS